MKKSTWTKRAVATFLVVLMSINSFAAVVGDNDGAAFITKAEFESLKNDFQTQINRYNSSLDDKIDGAIASYLAGVRVAPQSILSDELKKAKTNSEDNVRFVLWEDPNATKDVPDVQAGLYWNIITGAQPGAQTTLDKFSGGFILSNGAAWSGAINDYRYHNFTETVSNYDSYYYLINFPFGEADNDNRRTIKNITDWTLNGLTRFRCYFKLRSQYQAFGWAAIDIDEANIQTMPATITSDFTRSGLACSTGPGFGTGASHRVWCFDGNPTLSISHSWSSWNDTNSGSADVKRKSKKLACMFAGTLAGSCKAVDFNFRDAYTPDNQYNVQIAAYAAQAGNDGSKSGEQRAYAKWNGSSFDWRFRGYNNNIQFWWKWNRQTIYSLSWVNLTHKYYNEIFSTQHYKYQGIPICKTPTKVGKIKLKLKFTNKVLTTGANVNPTSSANYYTYVITDKKFKNGNLPSKGSTDTYWRDTDGYDHVFLRAVRNSGTYQYTTDWIEIDKSKIIDKDNGDYIYIKVSPNNADQVVTVEVADLITYTEEG